MTIELIAEKVKRLKLKYGHSDPESFCHELGILIRRMPMGREDHACKGFFIKHSRIPLIMLNNDLPQETQRIILVHELGHAILHANTPDIRTFHDFELFDAASMYEYEANIFAAEFLISDDDVFELLNEELSFFSAARMLCVPPELLDFKFRILKRRGYALNPPLYSSSSFMRNIDCADRF